MGDAVVMLALLIVVLVAGAFASLWLRASSRWVALFAVTVDLILLLGMRPSRHLDLPWIPPLGARVHLFADGTSLALLLLALLLGLLAIVGPWRETRERPGFYHFNLLLVLAGVAGVFTAIDLFLFYFFWELMLIPMYFLIAIWGHAGRSRAAVKFFVFTQAGSLLLLLATVALALFHFRATGVMTFDASRLLATKLPPLLELVLFLGFFLGFAVKLPAVPIHTWLPDAHTEAPTAGSVLLAGLLLKTGAYGLIRFAIPLFPSAASRFADAASIVGVIGIVYGAFLAFAQRDLKRMIAYTSISHLGFVLIGAFSLSPEGREGAVLQMIAHGFSAGGLFLLAGALESRLGTRDLRFIGGLMPALPRMAAAGLLLALASLGLPGMGHFIAEISVLTAAFAIQPAIAIAAGFGLVLATLYAVALYQSIFWDRLVVFRPVVDFGARELLVFAGAIVILLAIGLHPQPLIDLIRDTSLPMLAGGP